MAHISELSLPVHAQACMTHVLCKCKQTHMTGATQQLLWHRSLSRHKHAQVVPAAYKTDRICQVCHPATFVALRFHYEHTQLCTTALEVCNTPEQECTFACPLDNKLSPCQLYPNCHCLQAQSLYLNTSSC